MNQILNRYFDMNLHLLGKVEKRNIRLLLERERERENKRERDKNIFLRIHACIRFNFIHINEAAGVADLETDIRVRGSGHP